MNPWTPVAGVIIREVTDALLTVAEGTEENLSRYAEALTTAAVRAAEQGDEISLESIKRTSRMLAYESEIESRDGAWETVGKVAWAIVRAGVLSVTAITAA